ncbi:MAG: nonstructural protein [Microvirus sp.]|nr:MAG: nonstructural protein [Microvirus sp.]
MTFEVCSVFDSATDSYGRPFLVPHVGQAVRSFTDEARNPESDIAKHPGDFTLFHLCSFDDRFGRFTEDAVPRVLIRAADIIKP